MIKNILDWDLPEPIADVAVGATILSVWAFIIFEIFMFTQLFTQVEPLPFLIGFFSTLLVIAVSGLLGTTVRG